MTARHYQWLLFDADGTLFDYDRAEISALRQAFEQIRVPFQPEHLSAYRQINRDLWEALERGLVSPSVLKVRRFELLFQSIGVRHSAEAFSALYLERLAACSELVDGAREVIEALRPKYRLAIVTNGLKAVQRSRLAHSAIRDAIAEIIISEEVGHAKPAREYFDAAFARLGHPPAVQVLMVGDSWTSDIAGADQYGLDTCWYNPARRPRPTEPAITREIASLRELLPWLA